MKTLRQTLQQAESDAVAIGHFNISDLVGLKAAFDSARVLNVPVVVVTPEGERKFMGVHQAAAIVKSFREEYEFPIFLNADHTHSLRAAIEAAKAGYDWVVFDVSSQSFEQNIRQTKEAVEALKSIRPDILVEGEIGDIGSGSEIHDLAGDLLLTTPLRDHLRATVNDSLFDQRNSSDEGGFARRIFGGVSNYTHSRPGHADSDMRESNGPIYVKSAFNHVAWTQFEVMGLCLVLLLIARPKQHLPRPARVVLPATSI
jgi:hypothetical protein